MSREVLRNQFIKKNGFLSDQLTAIPGDLSSRLYFNVNDGNKNYVVMDCPPDTNHFCEYISIAKFLAEQEFSVPEIHDIDLENGFILMEDLGDYKIGKALNNNIKLPDEANEEKIYKRMIDVLVKLHNITPLSALENMEDEAYILESRKFIEWYVEILIGEELKEKSKEEFTEIMKYLLKIAKIYSPVMMLRDYHVDNLFWLPERVGHRKIGIIDFQDAKIASPAYDIVSLLEDARRDVSPELASKMISHYLKSFPQYERKDFLTAYHILGAQRNLKIIGLFSYKATKEKQTYLLKSLPRVIAHLKNDLRHPLLMPLKEWFDKTLPQKTIISAMTYGSGNTKLLV